ncbi:hypothetical protein DRE_07565 [Drechslerella stenobrocha 248]|uniref:FAM86 N-terminal domain-containing protein n=1 Tax=Drechslerella stenobrocha 248 TaxID=1043628 RepID=W7I422_9PEZI|nr:hypothetical protein DRE_07565 [Drechslerella stenobrocha 248]
MTEDSLLHLRRLYLQAVPAAKIPFDSILPAPVDGAFQQRLYNTVLSKDATAPHPPAGAYTRRFLKFLVDAVQQRLAEDEEIDGDILALYAGLLSSSDYSNDLIKPAYITYLLPSTYTLSDPKITISERNSLLSADGHTGSRTWEAALALGEHFLTSPPSLARPLSESRVLELGAGTAFASILLSKLRANYVLATDGDERVCEAIRTNIDLNVPAAGSDGYIAVSQLLWGASQADNSIYSQPWDLIIGGDITYDITDLSDLVYTISRLLQCSSERGAVAIISATVRNKDTIREFEAQLALVGLTFYVKQVEDDGRRLWYYGSTSPIRIYTISLA